MVGVKDQMPLISGITVNSNFVEVHNTTQQGTIELPMSRSSLLRILATAQSRQGQGKTFKELTTTSFMDSSIHDRAWFGVFTPQPSKRLPRRIF